MNVTMEVPKAKIEDLKAALLGTGRALPKELKIAINKTSSVTKTKIAQDVRVELVASAKEIKKYIKNKKRATESSLGANVVVEESKPMPLKAFKPRQTKSGVSYASKGGRKTVKSAFIVDKFGGHVFKRESKKRLRIQKLHAASVWGAYLKNNLDPETRNKARAELSKQIDRRIRTLLYKY